MMRSLFALLVLIGAVGLIASAQAKGQGCVPVQSSVLDNQSSIADGLVYEVAMMEYAAEPSFTGPQLAAMDSPGGLGLWAQSDFMMTAILDDAAEKKGTCR